jgi:hypothetical protein
MMLLTMTEGRSCGCHCCGHGAGKCDIALGGNGGSGGIINGSGEDGSGCGCHRNGARKGDADFRGDGGAGGITGGCINGVLGGGDGCGRGKADLGGNTGARVVILMVLLVMVVLVMVLGEPKIVLVVVVVLIVVLLIVGLMVVVVVVLVTSSTSTSFGGADCVVGDLISDQKNYSIVFSLMVLIFDRQFCFSKGMHIYGKDEKHS